MGFGNLVIGKMSPRPTICVNFFVTFVRFQTCPVFPCLNSCPSVPLVNVRDTRGFREVEVGQIWIKGNSQRRLDRIRRRFEHWSL